MGACRAAAHARHHRRRRQGLTEAASLANATRRPVRRVALGFVEISGYYARLAEGLREAGVEPWLLLVRPHVFGYETEARAPFIVRLVDRTHNRFVRMPVLAIAFVAALVRCDAFVVAFPSTRWHRLLLQLLRLLRRRTITIFHGSDHRPPYCDAAWRSADDGRATAEAASLRRSVVRAAEQAGVIIANPISAPFHTKPFVPFLRIGAPVRTGSARTRAVGTAVRVLHAPSDPKVKGTAAIRAAVDGAVAQGHAIEYEELTGVPNTEVLARLANVDLVVDQAYSDTPMTGVGSEAASVGCAVLVGSFAHRELAHQGVDDAMPPAFVADPDDLTGALIRAIADPIELERRGRAAQEFVATLWSPRSVADRVRTLLDDGPPPEWLVEPRDFAYLWGCGLTRDEVRRRVRIVVDACGPAGLALSDRPDLERAYLAEIR